MRLTLKTCNRFFLDLDHVLQIHRSLIETYGGIEGVRDIGLLHSAIAMPQASFGGEFLHNDLLEMAAAYLYHITLFWMAINELGAAAAIIFLAVNDISLQADEDALVALTLAVAEGEAGKQQIAEFFRKKAC